MVHRAATLEKRLSLLFSALVFGTQVCGCDALWLSSDDDGYTAGDDVRGWGDDCTDADREGCLAPSALERGKALYESDCASCHGSDGDGSSEGPSVLRSFALEDRSYLQDVILNGYGDMEAVPLTWAEAGYVVDYGLATFDLSGYLEAEESWNSTGVVIDIHNGFGSYLLGMAETATGDDPWTGEDCLNGYELSDGTLLYFCHPLDTDGGAFVSIYDDVVAGSRSLSSLDEDTETLFSEDVDGRITYAIWSDSTGDCWTWGQDTSYYVDGADCVEL